MSDVLKSELAGFRPPTYRERDWIAARMKAENRRDLRFMNFWLAVCAVISGSLLLNLLTKFNEQPLGYNAVSFLLFCGTALGVWEIRKGKGRKKERQRKVEQGDYSVLDCRAYNVYFPLRYTSIALVKVYSAHGQYCGEDFRVARSLGRLCREDPGTALILFKCDDYYQVIERNAGGGEK